jgi:hypothetical protein
MTVAVESKYTRQMAFVGTDEQYARLRTEADRRKVSVAAILRAAIDYRYGLEDGEAPEKAPGQEPGTPPGTASVQFSGGGE